jgi:hypothetical protein
VYLAALAVVGLGVALTFHVLTNGSRAAAEDSNPTPVRSTAAETEPADGAASSSAPSTSTTRSPATTPSTTPTRSTTRTRSTTPTSSPIPTSAPATTSARAAVAALVAGAPAGGLSVAAYNTTTGATYSAGAASGMVTASVVKLELLETMLLQHERTHTTLSSYENSIATTMIENSNNDSAEDVFEDDGDRAGVLAAEPQLGLSSTLTVPGTTDYWGLTTTSASQQLILLTNLVSRTAPLDAASQQYALTLMRNVEGDQRWGVGVAADPGTDFANKNGWLDIDADDGLWAVNSDGVITVHGEQVLISVLSQHDQNESSGITLIQTVAKAAASVVA